MLSSFILYSNPLMMNGKKLLHSIENLMNVMERYFDDAAARQITSSYKKGTRLPTNEKSLIHPQQLTFPMLRNCFHLAHLFADQIWSCLSILQEVSLIWPNVAVTWLVKMFFQVCWGDIINNPDQTLSWKLSWYKLITENWKHAAHFKVDKKMNQ